jgi:protein-arginine kinase activator protein McsA
MVPGVSLKPDHTLIQPVIKQFTKKGLFGCSSCSENSTDMIKHSNFGIYFRSSRDHIQRIIMNQVPAVSLKHQMNKNILNYS